MVADSVAARYRGFAEMEARGVSPTYEEWALGVGGDEEVAALIGTLPRAKQQANLVFASARAAGAPLADYERFRTWLVPHWRRVRAIITVRSTQTNEAGRCAVLLPALDAIDGPLALLEVGASAGLCLYPDRYSYRYDTPAGAVAIDPTNGPSPVLARCRTTATTLPARVPEVVWRAGIDLHPLDPSRGDDLAWLEALVWPEHGERRERLRSAASLVAAEPRPADIVPGDLVAELDTLAAAAPKGATLVVFHSSVLVYLDPGRRSAFVDIVRSLRGARWLSNEGEGVFPDIARKLPEPAAGRTVLAVDGEPIAFTGPHGQSYEPIEADPGERVHRPHVD
ncbi:MULTISPECIES: DUF2332 domain-containing protein [Microbacterium]|uniref:DUF2332 domain-containing protein n=1 Tax=Microbacterium wangchenii TaxID=2541726 RepID=A0ABX5SUI5_9MICO|nr:MULTISPECIES: DUF2332 domain-containing protein [Microbacterium]MCK6067194.1 DUF2332 domain-containing protein [Microbacterium sp. EYE_512]QBR89853.1 DUF2332 domain-containing protein [Microbacterium wangchenii]TFV85289.1 DUF2332 domain-containing protein [Microbacterium sp. dk485]TXK16550.1 DUF2332 domain-containing protein [Microbacterium wangchenii]